MRRGFPTPPANAGQGLMRAEG